MTNPFPKIPIRHRRRAADPTKPKTPRSEAYRAWLRTQPCAFCRAPPPSEVSHHGQHGTGLKASDWEALSSCRPCHRTHHATGVVPGAPQDRDKRREWLLRLARLHVKRWRRSRR